jgi:hypothetical protein
MRENHATSTQDRSAAPSLDHASRGADISPDVLRRACRRSAGQLQRREQRQSGLRALVLIAPEAFQTVVAAT